MKTITEVTAIAKSIVENHMDFTSGRIKSVQHGDKRLSLIRQGLQLIADGFDFPALVPHCDSMGEFSFAGNKGIEHEGCAPYGEELANLLNQIHVRNGIQAKKGFQTPEGGWCRINHFEAERMIFKSIGATHALVVSDKGQSNVHGMEFAKGSEESGSLKLELDGDTIETKVGGILEKLAKDSSSSLDLVHKNIDINVVDLYAN